MISAKKTAPREQFEKLLEASREDLQTTLEVGQSLSSLDFELAVLNAMIRNARGTAFEGEIAQTEEREFPDLVVADYYGVEVKQTGRARFVTSGNSIFETTRHAGVEDIYIMMARTGGGADVRWRRYEDALTDVVITHSPRYAISLEDDAVPVFERMGIDYETFRVSSQEEMMERVRCLYRQPDRIGRQLWWLSTEIDRPVYRLWRSCSETERDGLAAEMMFWCPESFGASNLKFQSATIYALSKGILIPNIRDAFSAGGQVEIGDETYPQIFGKATELLDRIARSNQDADTEALAVFWDGPVPGQVAARWDTWVGAVAGHSGRQVEFLRNV
jgi:hypothetical protein